MESLRLDIEIKKEKKKIKRENEDTNLHVQVHQTGLDLDKKLLEVTGELGKVTKSFVINSINVLHCSISISIFSTKTIYHYFYSVQYAIIYILLQR